MSLESLRFMLGGKIKKSSSADSVLVDRTEEVVVGADGLVPKPKDHLTGIELTPVASTLHPIRVINLTKGIRTQLTSGSIDGTKGINFKNKLMTGGETYVAAEQGDRLRIFWTEEVTTTDEAVEVVISPDTFPKRSGATVAEMHDGKSLLIDLEGPCGRQGASVMAA